MVVKDLLIKQKSCSKKLVLRVQSNKSLLQRSNLISHDSAIIDNPNEYFDYLYKLIIIGDEQVGKTNFMLRITRDKFEKKPKTTYGVEFEFKTIHLPKSNQRVKT